MAVTLLLPRILEQRYIVRSLSPNVLVFTSFLSRHLPRDTGEMMYTRNYLDLQPRPELFTPTKHAVAVAATTPVRLAKGPILDETATAGNVALWYVV